MWLLLRPFVMPVAICAAVAIGYSWHRGQLIDQGYQKAMNELHLQEADYQRELNRETSRLLTATRRNQDEYDAQRKTLGALERRVAGLAGRLQVRDSEFEASVQAASADHLRRYAATVDGDFGRCIADVGRLGAEAAKSAAAAHALKRQLDLLTEGAASASN